MPRRPSQVSIGTSVNDTDSTENFSEQSSGENAKYVLPEGQKSCPIEDCTFYGKSFEPHWRLNEHMKKRHGWPRKMTQPHTDRRRSGAHRSPNYPASYGKRTLSSDRESDRLHKRAKRSSTHGSMSGPSPSIACGITYRDGMDPSITDVDVLVAVTALTQNASPASSSEGEGDTMRLRSRKTDSTTKETLDQCMIAEIISFIGTLRLAPHPFMQNLRSPRNPDTSQPDPEKTIEALQNYVDSSLIRVNTGMSKEVSSSLMKVYQALAARRVAQAQARGGPVIFVGGQIHNEPISLLESNKKTSDPSLNKIEPIPNIKRRESVTKATPKDSAKKAKVSSVTTPISDLKTSRKSSSSAVSKSTETQTTNKPVFSKSKRVSKAELASHEGPAKKQISLKLNFTPSNHR